MSGLANESAKFMPQATDDAVNVLDCLDIRSLCIDTTELHNLIFAFFFKEHISCTSTNLESILLAPILTNTCCNLSLAWSARVRYHWRRTPHPIFNFSARNVCLRCNIFTLSLYTSSLCQTYLALCVTLSQIQVVALLNVWHGEKKKAHLG